MTYRAIPNEKCLCIYACVWVYVHIRNHAYVYLCMSVHAYTFGERVDIQLHAANPATVPVQQRSKKETECRNSAVPTSCLN